MTDALGYARPRPPRRAPDVVLGSGANPRPTGRGWLLVDYDWDEKTGAARLTYRRKWNPKERLVVEVPQPAGAHQPGWSQRPDIDRPAVLGRYFESLAVTRAKQSEGAYAR